ncbi:MAG: hypothetical protein IJK89_11340 [Clostridia bacterium]|nr:hypothetical protein [Clostridia bacterium]
MRSAGFSVRRHNGVPTLFHGDRPFPAAAYMTYLEEYARYEDFAKAGYRLFSFPALCAGKWISATKGFRPFGKGMFDEAEADFTGFDASVRRILAACPEAYLLPRVNLCAPDRWLRTHPEETDGSGERESLFSEEWRAFAEDMLRRLIAHVNGSCYRDRIAGYHLAGGDTEEWFHFDRNAGLSPAAEKGFAAFLAKNRPDLPFAGLPDLSLLNGEGPCHGSPYLAAYLEFASEAAARAVARLARTAKETAGEGVVVGAFYGYALEVPSPLYGTHALQTLLECDDIDFICSPNSYLGIRGTDADWTEMYAADSVRLHGKLCVQECDIRTHLTKLLCERAPEYDPRRILTAPIWHGLPDRKTAIAQMRKSFARQLIKGNGFWWFDMWGGWYDDPALMAEMTRFCEIYTESLTKPDRGGMAEIAVFIDERAYARMTDCDRRNAICGQRGALGHMGAPYDIYDVSDFPAVYGKYKGVILFTGIATEGAKAAMDLCSQSGTPYLCNIGRDPFFSVEELRTFCGACGTHLYADAGDIIYVNAHYVAIHAVTGGTKTLRFPTATTLRDLLDGALPLTGRRIVFSMEEGETRLFARD